MTSEKISLKERYLLQENKEEFFKTLVKNSETYLVMRVNDHLSRHGLSLPEDSQKELKALLDQRNFSSAEKRKVEFKQLLLKIEQEENEAELKSLIKIFNTKFLSQNFSHQRPASLKQGQGLKAVGEKVIGSTIPANIVDDTDFEKAKEDFFKQPQHKLISRFKSFSFRRFKLKRLLEKNSYCFEYVCNILEEFTHEPEFAVILKAFVKQKRKFNKNYHPPVKYYEKMTLLQLEEYKAAFSEANNDKNFILSHFVKTFELTFGQFPADLKEEPAKAREVLIKMYEWTQRMNVQFSNFPAQILLAILDVGVRLGIFDKKYFLEYVKNPHRVCQFFTQEQKKTVNSRPYGSYDSTWNRAHNIPSLDSINADEIIKAHLSEFFKRAANYSEFEVYFKATYLKQIFYTTKLTQGEDIDKISEIYTETQLQALKEKRILKFAKKNKVRFGADEEVKLELEIKNIPNLTINTFEISPENFYRKNMKEINARIKLDGLLPAKQTSLTYDQPPIITHHQEFAFEDIQARKRGIFIIEFIGGGLSSRVMIRKGSLTLVKQNVRQGVVFHVVNEQKEVCKNATTGILFENKLYKADAEGKILIPFQTNQVQKKCIVLDEDFAELVAINIPSESIRFEASLLFNEESLFPGCNAQFVLQPKLFSNSKLIALSNLKEVSAEIEIINERGVKNSRKFDDLKLSYSEDVVLNYIIPPKARNIRVVISAKVKSLVNEVETVHLVVKEIVITKFDGNDRYYTQYLKKSRDGYKVQFLGLNGEPFKGYSVQVKANTLYGAINQPNQVVFVLNTDENGEIDLGQLNNFATIEVQMRNTPGSVGTSPQTYKLHSTNRIDNLPSEFSFVEGEEFLLPAGTLATAGVPFSQDHYSLVKFDKNNQYVIGNYRDKIRQDGSMIFLEGLKEGLYRFKYTYEASGKHINLRVYKGERWAQANQYILQEDRIIKLLSQNNYLVYRDLEVTEDKLNVRVESNQPETVKVHVLGLNHYGQTLARLESSLKSFLARENDDFFEFGKSDNTYLSEKNLSDEVKYVLERKRKATFMGNTLEKPSSLLKRHFNKKTSADVESLRVERDYSQAQGNLEKLQRVLRQGSAIGGSAENYIDFPQSNDFLKNQGRLLANNTGEEGIFSIDISSLAAFGTLFLVIEDSRSSVCEILAHNNVEIEKKSITLQNSKTANKVYLYQRDVHKLSQGEELNIEDLASTEMSIIDDRKTLFSMLKLLYGNNSETDEWAFLEKWSSLEPQEQLAKYDKYISHEFNLFAYFRDKEFFDLVVKDHLIHKAEKDLIDHFLLGQYDHLEKYLAPQRLENLSFLERGLLVVAFKDTKPDHCQRILKDLKARTEQQFWCLKTYKQKFDTVLTARKNEEEPIALDGVVVPNPLANLNNMSNVVTTTAMRNFAPPMMPQQMLNYAPPVQMMQQAITPVMNDRYTRNRAPNRAHARSARRNFSRAAPQMAYEARAVQNVSYAYNESLQLENAYIIDDEDFGGYNNDLLIAGGAPPPAPERFRTMGVTNEYIERKYYKSETIVQGDKSIKLWTDFVAHTLNPETQDRPFLSENFIYTTSSITDILAALAILDLPEQKESHAVDNSAGFKLTAGSTCMIFSKQMKEKGNEKLDLDVIISQRFFDPNDRYVISKDGKTKMFKKIKEFLVGTIYGSRIAITNSSESEHEVQVITEIPQGAIPVNSLEYSKSTTIKLNPLSTRILEFSFYFPAEGEFTCYPASITKEGFLVASAPDIDVIKVTKEQTQIEMNTIKDILAAGSKEDILNFMKEQNLYNGEIFNFNSIYWLLKDREFYDKVLEILRDKLYFDATVWSYSIYHADLETFKEFLDSVYKGNRVSHAGFQIAYLNSPLLHIDDFQFKEYNPLINPRVHDIGEHKHNILNRDFKTTYSEFLSYLVDKREITSRDYLYLAVYFLLQDRIDDALAIYPKINQEDLEGRELRVQYDYLTAYLDLYNDYPNFVKAREICGEYLAYPVFTWRNRFINLANQIAEFDGEVAIENVATEDDKTAAKNKKEAERQEYIQAELEGGKIKVTSKNVSAYKIAFYKIDLEIMFSQDPFLSVGMSDYSFVRANLVQDKTLDASTDYSTTLEEIPEEFVHSNMLIQITCGAKTENLTYFPSSLKAFVIEGYGQIKVTTQDGKPLSKVYVKCFSKKKSGGAVAFYKDGYTDLRGTFDYASLNLDGVTGIDKFALLVVSEDKGAIIKQVDPPTSLSKVENRALDLKSKKWAAQHKSYVAKKSKMNRYMM